MRILLIILSLVQCGFAGDLKLVSTVEKTFTPDGGQAYGDIHRIVFTWTISKEGATESTSKFVVVASRRLRPDRKKPHYWKAKIHPDKNKDMEWHDEAHLTTDEFISIVSQSEQELRKQNANFHFNYIYIPYHSVTEHETEITPKLRHVLANTEGKVRMKHRGIMSKFHHTFNKSTSTTNTSRALQAKGLDFSPGHMEGDYYTPVNPELAETWKDASKLDGFGLHFPPTIVFRRKMSESAKQ